MRQIRHKARSEELPPDKGMPATAYGGARCPELGLAMTPAGYMAKKVVKRPDWLKADAVEDLYSVSGCISEYFADYIPHWKHNGYWFFDSVESIRSLAREHSISLEDCRVFYYEVFEREFNDETDRWESFGPEESFKTSVVPPAKRQLEGYDVVTFTVHTSPECSPLSCNGAATAVLTNRHCLLSSLDEAKALVEGGAFENTEPGPFRIFAVYTVDEA